MKPDHLYSITLYSQKSGLLPHMSIIKKENYEVLLLGDLKEMLVERLGVCVCVCFKPIKFKGIWRYLGGGIKFKKSSTQERGLGWAFRSGYSVSFKHTLFIL